MVYLKLTNHPTSIFVYNF